MLAKRPYDSGIKDAPEWNLCGAVYCMVNPPVNIRHMVFMPWLLPIPTLRSDGNSDIEILAQVTTDIGAVIDTTGFQGKNYTPASLGSIRYTVLVERQTGWHARSIHIGELRRTPIENTYMIRLHTMPFVMVAPSPMGRYTPVMALTAEAWSPGAEAKSRNARERNEKLASGAAIVNATFPTAE